MAAVKLAFTIYEEDDSLVLCSRILFLARVRNTYFLTHGCTNFGLRYNHVPGAHCPSRVTSARMFINIKKRRTILFFVDVVINVDETLKFSRD